MDPIGTIYSTFVVCESTGIGDKSLAIDKVFPSREAALEGCRALTSAPPVTFLGMTHKPNHTVISLHEYIEEQRSISYSDGVSEGRDQMEQNFSEREK